jgi:hypothetical protein
MNSFLIAIVRSFAAGAATATVTLRALTERHVPVVELASDKKDAFRISPPTLIEINRCFEVVGGEYRCF